jgi:hypothetical protein
MQQHQLSVVLAGDVAREIEGFLAVLGAVEGHQDPFHPPLY